MCAGSKRAVFSILLTLGRIRPERSRCNLAETFYGPLGVCAVIGIMTAPAGCIISMGALRKTDAAPKNEPAENRSLQRRDEPLQRMKER